MASAMARHSAARSKSAGRSAGSSLGAAEVTGDHVDGLAHQVERTHGGVGIGHAQVAAPVVGGDVVDAIGAVKTGRGDRPVEEVVITKATIE